MFNHKKLINNIIEDIKESAHESVETFFTNLENKIKDSSGTNLVENIINSLKNKTYSTNENNTSEKNDKYAIDIITKLSDTDIYYENLNKYDIEISKLYNVVKYNNNLNVYMNHKNITKYISKRDLKIIQNIIENKIINNCSK